MCGILGKISLSDIVQTDIMHTSLDLIEHRGPDAKGVWISPNGNIWLGHRRLSIIDLSSDGAQPMISFDESFVIVFNGEIYNYKSIRDELKAKGYPFKSDSDTEVLLNAWHCWGEDLFQRLDGMFAFALLDVMRNTILMARDRAGEKPLYYSFTSQGLTFASELKSVLYSDISNRKFNHQALDCLLGFGYVPGDMCIVDGVNKLPPASFLKWKIGEAAPVVKPYWIPPKPLLEFQSDQALLEKMDTILGQAVKSQMVADVPVGVMLSGGLDSSLITAYASENDRDIYTFTVGFEGYGGADERHFARQIAQWFGTRHKELNVDGANPEIMSILAAQCCEPSTDPAIIPGYLIYKASSEYCKVVMGGDGADEIFGGYDRYEQWLKIKNQVSSYPNRLKEIISYASEKIFPIGLKGRHYLMQFATDFNHSIPLKDNLFTMSERRCLLTGKVSIQDTSMIKRQLVEEELAFMERAMRYDFKGFLPENILTKVDRSSMLSSVEVRSPFLSKGILEFAMEEVNPDLKRRKKILRQLAQRKLPHFINTQRKQGFIPPLEFWMKEKKWQEFINDNLYADGSIFSKPMLANLMNREGKQFFNKRRVFTLLMVQLWMKSYKVSI
jgi:asparagine synthase (glutamine-hydrolysing)